MPRLEKLLWDSLQPRPALPLHESIQQVTSIPYIAVCQTKDVNRPCPQRMRHAKPQSSPANSSGREDRVGMTLRGEILISEAALRPEGEEKRAGATSGACPSLSTPPWALIPECSPAWAFLAADGSGLWTHFPRRHISFEWEVSQAHVADPRLALFS